MTPARLDTEKYPFKRSVDGGTKISKLCFLIIFILIVLGYGTDYNYSLEDINPNSENYGNYVGPNFFTGKVTLHYFGSFT